MAKQAFPKEPVPNSLITLKSEKDLFTIAGFMFIWISNPA
jgi:hypothetical protein